MKYTVTNIYGSVLLDVLLNYVTFVIHMPTLLMVFSSFSQQ